MPRRKYLENKIISNDEYIEYYNKWKVLIKSALNKFRVHLNEHDLESCGNYALLLCIQRYDGRPNVKFSTMLVNYVNWECKRTIAERFKYKDVACINSMGSVTIESFELVDLLNSLSFEDSKMIKDRYINNLTLNEMAAIYKVSRETIRKRLFKIRKRLMDEDAIENML